MFNTPGRRRGPGSPSTPEDYLYRRSVSASASRRRKQHGPEDPSSRPLTSTRARSHKKKPQWINTNHDLSQYKLTKDELLKKKLSTVSKHNTLLRYELQRKFGNQLETGVNDKGEFVIALSTSQKKQSPNDNPQSPGKLPLLQNAVAGKNDCPSIAVTATSYSRPQRLTGQSEEQQEAPSSKTSPTSSTRKQKRKSPLKESKVAKELSFGGSPAVRFAAETKDNSSQGREVSVPSNSATPQQSSGVTSGDVLTPLRKNPEGCLETIFKAVMRDKARQAGVTPGSKINIETPWSKLDPEETADTHPSYQERTQGQNHSESEIDMTVSDSESAAESARGESYLQQQSPTQKYPQSIHGGVKVSSDLARTLESDKHSTMSTWEKQRRERHRQHLEQERAREHENSPTGERKQKSRSPAQRRKSGQQPASHDEVASPRTNNEGTNESLEESETFASEGDYRAGPFEWDDPQLAQAIRKVEKGLQAFSQGKPPNPQVSFSEGSDRVNANQRGFEDEDTTREREAGSAASIVSPEDAAPDKDNPLQRLREELRQEREARRQLAETVESFKENISPGGLRDMMGQRTDSTERVAKQKSGYRAPLQTLVTSSESNDDEELSIYNPDADSNEEENNQGERRPELEGGETNEELTTVSTFYSMDQRIYNPSHYAEQQDDDDHRFYSEQYAQESTEQEEEPLPAPRPTPQPSPAAHPPVNSVSRNFEVYRDVQFHSNENLGSDNVRSNADAVLQSSTSVTSSLGALPTEDAASRFEQLRERIFRLKQQSNAL
eukprot:gb/GECG01007296.1/.p1 GENE.gb/GECG01007296.1/~~gb/GECG01007296.1/.p1  ORF type:complete len:781 (+),score=133.41 gb/GECG01007296.1/:1-2343(+)